MSRSLVAAGLLFWAGAAISLTESRRFNRSTLTERLRAYEPGGLAEGRRAAAGFSAAAIVEAVGPLAVACTSRLASAVGSTEDAADLLAVVHSPLTVVQFRLRQVLRSGAVGLVGMLVVAATHPPILLSALLIAGGSSLTFLFQEQALLGAAKARRQRLRRELPVVAEQLGMLLDSGFSLGGALHRLAERGQGETGEDLASVVARLAHGADVRTALREWADLAKVDDLNRLITVLSLNVESNDIGTLIAAEARSMRRSVHRDLVEQIERRSQQVWIPVTVAALVPGVIFVAVPFLDAVRAFTTV